MTEIEEQPMEAERQERDPVYCAPGLCGESERLQRRPAPRLLDRCRSTRRRTEIRDPANAEHVADN